VDPSFPQPPDLVREIVAVSHGNVARVRELVAERRRRVPAALGDADLSPALAPLSPADLHRLAGSHSFGPAETDRLEVTIVRGHLGLTRTGGNHRVLYHLGANESYPSGAEAVRVRFTITGARSSAPTVHGPGLVLEARRPIGG
jgi:hypothetical protein